MGSPDQPRDEKGRFAAGGTVTFAKGGFKGQRGVIIKSNGDDTHKVRVGGYTYDNVHQSEFKGSVMKNPAEERRKSLMKRFKAATAGKSSAEKQGLFRHLARTGRVRRD